MKKKLFFLMAIGLVLAVDANAGDTATINNYLNTINGIIGNKVQIIGITLVMIFSGIMAWKNASVAPLGWGGAASIAIAGSGSIANKLHNLSI